MTVAQQFDAEKASKHVVLECMRIFWGKPNPHGILDYYWENGHLEPWSAPENRAALSVSASLAARADKPDPELTGLFCQIRSDVCLHKGRVNIMKARMLRAIAVFSVPLMLCLTTLPASSAATRRTIPPAPGATRCR